MYCTEHGSPIVARCSQCGKYVCAECLKQCTIVEGKYFCDNCGGRIDSIVQKQYDNKSNKLSYTNSSKTFLKLSPFLLAISSSLTLFTLSHPLFAIFFVITVILYILQYSNINKAMNIIPKAKSIANNIISNANAESERIIQQANSQAAYTMSSAKTDYENIIQTANDKSAEILSKFNNEYYTTLIEQINSAERKLSTQQRKLQGVIFLYNAINTTVGQFNLTGLSDAEMRNINEYINNLEYTDMLSPTAEIKLHNTDVKDLKKMYGDVTAKIDLMLSEYEKRYTAKTNAAIYRLMVIALKSELQNVLYTLKYNKLDNSIDTVKSICDKYLHIAAEGNQTIAPTMVKFIGIIQNLFIDAIKIEYEYYVRKEQIKEEQRQLREQMRQETEERKILEQQKQKIEKEEQKYIAEIEKLQQMLKEASADKALQIESKIDELNTNIIRINDVKSEIIHLQNGKAGCVYIISNLGAFGENVFKIGMTRRLKPQERVDELGDASVPFKFDVHSFIFSNDAVSLESNLHKRLNSKRLNKINLRKEFFQTTIDELQELVYEIEPSAEFVRTMVAEQYYQSQSIVDSLSEIDENTIDDDIDDE